MSSVTKRRRCDRHQPETSRTKVWNVGAVKTLANPCRIATKDGVSSMLGLLAVRYPGRLATPGYGTDKEAALTHPRKTSRNLRNLNLGPRQQRRASPACPMPHRASGGTHCRHHFVESRCG